MLVICERADPVSRRRRQIARLDMVVQHPDRLREGRAPSVAHKPLGRLFLRCGDEVHEAAEVRERDREDEVVMDAVHGHVVRGEALAAEGTSLGRLHDLHYRQDTVDEVRRLVELLVGDGSLRCISDRRAACQVDLGQRRAIRPRLVAFLPIDPSVLVSLDLAFSRAWSASKISYVKMYQISCEDSSIRFKRNTRVLKLFRRFFEFRVTQNVYRFF